MSTRDKIRMTEAEVDAFLEEQRTMSVATVGADGRPHVVAMWYAFIDGSLCFWTYAKSQKVVNLRRGDRITSLVEDGDVYTNLRGVELIARAHISDDEDEVIEFGVAESVRYQNTPASEAMMAAVKKMANKRVVVRLEIERVVSWDHRKLGGRY